MTDGSRWQRLFVDLDAQLDAAHAAELAGEVDERTRLELATVTLGDRLAASTGQRVSLHLVGHEPVVAELLEVADQWLLVGRSVPALVPTAALTGVGGLGPSAATGTRDCVRRRLGLASALRAVARDRSPVRLDLLGGATLGGTIDTVGSDHLDLAEHPLDEPRRRAVVRGVRTVPFTALVLASPAVATSSLVERYGG